MSKTPLILGLDATKALVGGSFIIHEWKGSGPDYLHVHHGDDEAWHVLEGTLRFRFSDSALVAPQGMTVLIPAGVAHTYSGDEGARYLMILTPTLDALISELHSTPYAKHAEVMKKYNSDIIS